MSSKIRIPHFLAVLLLCLTAAFSQPVSPVPGMIHYQGRIAVNNVNFAGPTGLFKFALVNADGTETYWTSDGTATGEPASSLTLPVANGLYAVNLGDSNVGGMPPILPSVFQGRDDVRLRIWFDDGVNGNQLLAPDQRFASVPYAMVAGSVAPGAVTPGSIGLGSISGILGCQIINTEFPGGQPGLGAFVSIPGTSFVAIAGTVTDQSAPYSIVNVPAGTYQVRADSGRGKVQTQTVTVVAGQNTVADFSLLSPSCPDTDFDGYGDAGDITESCSVSYGISPICTDTDDSDPFIHPGATEYCDGVDNDVDGTVDEECVLSECGNNYPEPGETCDDGNNTNGDGCSSICQIETATCGNGIQEFGEQCDDGNVTNGDGCTSACQIEIAVCGDGVLQAGEQCDDSNITPGDGCSASCQTECTLDSQCPSSGNVCLTSVCLSGTCTFVNNTASCDDGNACTQNDVCSSGTCNGTQKNCSDSNICTTDLCNPTNGACYSVNNTASCNDGNPCTSGDVCSDGICQSGTTPLDCDDNNPCTTDSCNPSGGCVHTPVSNGTSCSDNSLCTTGDTCQAGTCVGAPVTCPGDSNPCTTEACNPSTGCYQAFNTAPCDDGNLCTVSDSCNAGVCGGTQKNCSDGNVCTTDLCNPGTGACSSVNNTASCSDGNPCTTGDVCSAGICQPGTGACFAGVTCSGDGSGGFICGPCPSGYSGNGVTCIDTDSCAPNPCFAGVSCTDTPAPGNGFTCGACPTGYSGDGVTCTDVNSCSPNPCFPGVTCTDTPAPGNGFTCGSCPFGYFGDGITCTDINSCEPNPCFTGVSCTDTPAPGNGFTCGSCPPGYTGDGITCVPQ